MGRRKGKGLRTEALGWAAARSLSFIRRRLRAASVGAVLGALTACAVVFAPSFVGMAGLVFEPSHTQEPSAGAVVSERVRSLAEQAASVAGRPSLRHALAASSPSSRPAPLVEAFAPPRPIASRFGDVVILTIGPGGPGWAASAAEAALIELRREDQAERAQTLTRLRAARQELERAYALAPIGGRPGWDEPVRAAALRLLAPLSHDRALWEAAFASEHAQETQAMSAASSGSAAEKTDAHARYLAALSLAADAAARPPVTARVVNHTTRLTHAGSPLGAAALGAAIGFVAGLLLSGLGLAGRILRPEQASGAARAPLAALAPAVPQGQLQGLPPGLRTPAGLVVLKPQSLFATALRHALGVLNRLDGGGRPGRGRVVALTAGRHRAGSSAVCGALGRIASLSGIKTIAIDADVRRPGLATALGLTTVAGADLSRWEEAVQRDPESDLDVLALPARSSGSAAFPDVAFPSILESLRARYDLILVDCPPPGLRADAAIVAQSADCLTWVATWGLSDVGEASLITRALRLFRPEGLDAVLVNRADPADVGAWLSQTRRDGGVRASS